MRFPRRAGILMHLTSLPGPFGMGDLGGEARKFVDFLHRAGVQWWQVLPLGPTARGNSPYSSYSAFAGNPYLISPLDLVADGLLAAVELEDAPESDPLEANFEVSGPWKLRLLETVFAHLSPHFDVPALKGFDEFCREQGWWLEDYALFMAILEDTDEADWSLWDADLVAREPQALAETRQRLACRIRFQELLQFLFYLQWQRLRDYGRERGVEMLGDLPIFVAYESADAWAHQECFCLDECGRRTFVAGVPPDYFSETGQLWGNPLYRWEALESQNYDWWVKRLRHSFAIYDAVRVDHFRGFEAYWEVPADAPTAATGRWVPGPCAAPFVAAETAGVELRIVAEDLGSISDAVHALRDELEFPGMRVFQFGFDDDLGAYHRPSSYPAHSVGYTGTHDNDTIMGWFSDRLRRLAQDPGLRDRLLEHLDSADGTALPPDLHWEFIRQVFASAADTAIAPIQDVLGLGSEGRMNVPGEPEGNWRWRCPSGALTDDIASRLRHIVEATERCAVYRTLTTSFDRQKSLT